MLSISKALQMYHVLSSVITEHCVHVTWGQRHVSQLPSRTRETRDQGEDQRHHDGHGLQPDPVRNLE